jgi:hypothetical protein
LAGIVQQKVNSAEASLKLARNLLGPRKGRYIRLEARGRAAACPNVRRSLFHFWDEEVHEHDGKPADGEL